MKTVYDLIRLDDRKAVVTGGAGHIGLAVCETLLELGARVTIMDLEEDSCAKRCELLNNRSYKEAAIPLAVNLGHGEETRAAIKEAIQQMNGLDILIHSAAFVGTTDFDGWAVPFEEQTLEAWEAAMRVNLSAAFVMAQSARSALDESGHGAIIFINSIYGMVGPDNRLYEGTKMITPAGYAASKGGLAQLCRYLGTILASKIRVNSITAGGVCRNQAENFHKKYIERTPLRRMAAEEDFKGAVAYLASDLSAYVTGTNLVVDGGWTAW